MLLFLLPPSLFPLLYNQGPTCQVKLSEQDLCCHDFCSRHWREREICDVESRENSHIVKKC